MRRYVFCAGLILSGALIGSDGLRAQQSSGNGSAPISSHRALVDTYCVSCHSDALKTGGLTLQNSDLANVPAAAETWEKVIRKAPGERHASAGCAAARKSPPRRRSSPTWRRRSTPQPWPNPVRDRSHCII